MTNLKDLEEQAEAFSKSGDMQSTERICREILQRDANHISSLRFLADLATRSGQLEAAERGFRKLLAITPRDAQLYPLLGQVLYRQGKLPEAVAVYEQYWRLKPDNGMVYLALGCLHVELGDIDKAAQLFSLGESRDADLLTAWRNPKTQPAIAQMARTGWDTLRKHHTDLHLESVEKLAIGESTSRIRDAVWPLLDAREVSYRFEKQRAQVFYIDYQQAPAFFEREEFSWCSELEAQFDALRNEILANLDVNRDGHPYLGDGHKLEGEQWKHIVNSMNWASVHLYSQGVANKKLIDRFPATLKALEQVPVATYRDKPMEVFISVLAPGTRIPEHYGVSSAILTVHLPIVVPEGCGLKVNGEVRTPEEGKLLAFDDTWEHSAWNDSDEPRIVLIFEVWHPQLSDCERQAVLASFYAREQWLRERRVIDDEPPDASGQAVSPGDQGPGRGA